MSLFYFILFAEDINQAYEFVSLNFNSKSKYNHENPGEEEKCCDVGPVGPSAFHIGYIVNAETLLQRTQITFDSAVGRKHKKQFQHSNQKPINKSIHTAFLCSNGNVDPRSSFIFNMIRHTEHTRCNNSRKEQ